MKKSILFAAVASAVLAGHAALAAHAATDTAAVPPATSAAAVTVAPAAAPPLVPPVTPPMPLAHSNWLKAILAMSRESQAAAKSGNMVQMLDAQSKLQFTPETSKLLLEVFGKDHPLDFTRASAGKGRLRYMFDLAPHAYQEADGLKIEWHEMIGTVDVDKAGRNAETSIVWPWLLFDAPQLRVSLLGMNFDGKQSLGADGLWYGLHHAHIVSMTFDNCAPPATAPATAPDVAMATATASGAAPAAVAADAGNHADTPMPKAAPASGSLVRLDGLDYKGALVRHGKFSDFNYVAGIGRIAVGDDHVDHANVSLRVLHMDPVVLARLKTSLSQVRQDGKSNEQIGAATLPLMKQAGKALIKQGAELVIDDVSASYRGNSASLKGRVAFARVVDKDFDTPASLLNKLVAHFDARVSLKLVQDVARYVARKQLAATLGQRPAEEDVDRAAKGISGGMLDKAVTEGFVRIEDGELRVAVDFKDGKLAINGKAIPLPDMAAPRGAKPVPPPQPPK